MALHRLPDAEAVARHAAAVIERLVSSRPEPVLYLPAGATPLPLFRELERGAVDLSRAWLVQLDELVGVPPSDPRSFHACLRRHLLERVAHDPDRALLLDGGAADPGAEIARHAELAARPGPPDLVLLGLGRNGHVAFNEPGVAAEAGARRVTLAPATRDALRASFAPGPAPSEGITLGLAELARARRTLLLVTGSGKADVLRRLLDGPPSADLPASLLAGRPGFEVVADEAALGG